MKTKKYIKMYDRDSFLVTVERTKNDINGNPKYNISVFNKDTLHFKGNWIIVTYDLEHYIEVLLKDLKVQTEGELKNFVFRDFFEDEVTENEMDELEASD